MEAHPNFKARYLHSTFLGLEPVTTGHDLRNFSDIVQHPFFDIDEVAEKLGPKRFEHFMTGVKEVASIGHRTWPEGHEFAGCEVHCIHAADLEAFLAGGH
jgi:hypothetical protein